MAPARETGGDRSRLTGLSVGRIVPACNFAAVTDHPPEPFTRTYRLAMAVCRPLAWWSRMRVEGAEALPRGGPVLLAGQPRLLFRPDRDRDGGDRPPPDSGSCEVGALGRPRPGTGSRRDGADPDRAREPATPGRWRRRSRPCGPAPVSASSPRGRSPAAARCDRAAASDALRSRSPRRGSSARPSKGLPTWSASPSARRSGCVSSIPPRARPAPGSPPARSRSGSRPRSVPSPLRSTPDATRSPPAPSGRQRRRPRRQSAASARRARATAAP